jgi:RNA polymerase sigma factor (sigma-70 family)
MAAQDDSRTHPSLLGRVAADSGDQDAWRDFIARYGPKIYGWARAKGLQDADAQDVTAAVLQRLADRMRHFEYDPARSFRGWLRTLTQHAWADLLAARGSAVAIDLSAVGDIAARDDLVRRLEREFDLELLQEAQRRVRRQVAPTTWEAYRLTAVEGLGGAEVADRLGMKVANVFVAKSAVLARLKAEVRALGGAESRTVG